MSSVKKRLSTVQLWGYLYFNIYDRDSWVLLDFIHLIIYLYSLGTDNSITKISWNGQAVIVLTRQIDNKIFQYHVLFIVFFLNYYIM